MEVGWDPDSRTLFSPKPSEWSYLHWFRQIVAAAAGEYGVRLVVTPHTKWFDVPDALRTEIEAERKPVEPLIAGFDPLSASLWQRRRGVFLVWRAR
jgi:hypothetical protein